MEFYLPIQKVFYCHFQNYIPTNNHFFSSQPMSSNWEHCGNQGENVMLPSRAFCQRSSPRLQLSHTVGTEVHPPFSLLVLLDRCWRQWPATKETFSSDFVDLRREKLFWIELFFQYHSEMIFPLKMNFYWKNGWNNFV